MGVTFCDCRPRQRVPKIAELLGAPLALFGPDIGPDTVHFGLIATFWILATNP